MRRYVSGILTLVVLALGACSGGGGSAPDATTGADTATGSDTVTGADTATGVDTAPDAPAPDAAVDAAADTTGGCDPRTLGPGEVRAKWIACEDELIGGPHAAGMVGDVLLENDRVRFVVRAAASEGHVLLGLGPGGIVDADRVRPAGAPGEDRLRELFPLVSFNVFRMEEIAVVTDAAAGEASVRMWGETMPLPILADVIPSLPVSGRVYVEYALGADADHLALRTTVTVEGDDPTSMVAATDVLFLAGDQALFLPGPPRGDGETWKGPFVATEGVAPLAGGAPAPVSYGYVGPDEVHFFDMEGSQVYLAATRPVRPGTALMVERRLFVGDGSASSVTDALWTAPGPLGEPPTHPTGAVRGALDGATDPAAYRIVATDEDGAALTRFAPAADGTFEGLLPPGAARLVATCDGCPPATPVDVVVAEDDAAEATVPAPQPGRLVVRATGDDGEPLPARLSIVSLDAPERGRLLRFTTATTPPVALAPGRYEVTVTRGFEYALAVREVTIAAGEETRVAVPLERPVATPGAVAAEFHIHSELSADSAVPLVDRVLSVAAEGLEFVTPSEHDVIADYGPALAALALGGHLASVSGVEVSSIDAGHHNAWPVTPDPLRAGMGAPDWFDLSPPALVAAIRAAHPDAIVQVNHPRFDYGSAFEIIGFDPATARATVAPESLGFPPDTDLDALPYDAIEVFNGIGDEQLAAQLADWYALLNVGRRITATAGGDSHELRAYPGNPRNWVLVADDDPAALTAAAVADGVRAMRVVVSSGPYVELGVATGTDPDAAIATLPGMGEIAPAEGGAAPLAVRVQAPPWMAVDTLRVVANGAVVHEEDLTGVPAGEVVRFDGVLDIPVDRDTWLVVTVEGAARNPLAANHPPFAVTNPVFVDADGDGAFTPPGL